MDELDNETSANGEMHYAVPVLPLRDTVIFPQSILPLAGGRDSTVRLLDENGTSVLALWGQDRLWLFSREIQRLLHDRSDRG